MAVTVIPVPAAELVVDAQTGWFDEVLAGLAAGVAECGSRVGGVSDAVRVDRIARLERIKAAAGGGSGVVV